MTAFHLLVLGSSHHRHDSNVRCGLPASGNDVLLLYTTALLELRFDAVADPRGPLCALLSFTAFLLLLADDTVC